MATIVTRTGKGSALSTAEMDANFTNLNNAFDSIFIGSSFTLTNQANALQELNNVTNGATIDVPVNGYYTQIRLNAFISTASTSTNTPILLLQYSTDASTWTTIGTGTGTDVISMLTPTGFKQTAWMGIPAGAQNAETYFRVAQNGGDAAADPVVRSVTIQLRYA